MGSPAFATALQLLKGGRLEQALDLCRQGLEADPDNANGALLLASIEFRLGHKESARSSLDRAANSFGDQSQGLIQVIQAYQRTGHPAAALELSGRLPPGDPAVASLKAQLLWQTGRYDDALASFRQNLATQPDHEENHQRLARALIRFGHAQEASELLERALARFEGSQELTRLKILSLLDAHELPGAAAELAASSARPGVASSLHHLDRALGVAIDRIPISEPGYPFSNEHEAAAWEGFDWLYRQNPDVRLYGSGTGVLDWAVRHMPTDGIVVECGVYHGFSLSLIASRCKREIHGFDSFEGLPEDWKPGEPAGSYSTGGVIPTLPQHVKLHRGWFEETLPRFAGSLTEPISLLHVDCDLYSSTATVLNSLAQHLHPGAIVVFDDLLAYPGYREHEYRAAREFFAAQEHEWHPRAAVVLGRSVAFSR